ncbi:MAG: carbonic anhydrase [Candidatus Promineifilaceae bacterium]|nr:carbonic anhydrase [Candidatus Promineifilaceae bacterium]
MNSDNVSSSLPLDRLLAGNARFAEGRPQHPQQSPARREGLMKGQTPFALILSCSDSRVPPAIVFDQGLGDLFTVRTAGHVLDDAVNATLAFGIGVLQVPLVVVLGHEQCGAVAAALQADVDAGDPLAPLLARIRPALADLRPHDAAAAHFEAAVKANVHLVLGQVRALAASLREVPPRVIGAYYRLEDGRVEILEENEQGWN